MHGNSTNSVTPFKICQELAAKLVRPGHIILDMACGKGSYLLAAIQHLIRQGMSVKDAVGSVRGYDINQSQIAHTTVSIFRATGYTPKLQCIDSLTWESDEKFDVIMCTPPFFSRILGKSSTYDKFVFKAISLLKHDGNLGMLLPTTWLVSAKKTLFRKDILRQSSIDYIKLLGTTTFTENVDTCMVSISQGYTSTFTMSNIHNLEFSMSPINYLIPMVTSKIEYEILLKISTAKGLSVQRGKQPTVRYHGIKEFTTELSERLTRKCPRMLLSRLQGGSHEIYFTAKINDPDIDKSRVIFSRMSSLPSRIGYVASLAPGTQISNSICYIVCDDMAAADAHIAYLKSNLVTFLLERYRTVTAWSGHAGEMIPVMGSVHLTTDELKYIDTVIH
jgi:2-polyprenyl-3-methyl-5-hydroxy-6-metoxy-1,4-benzoquinol methylase